MKNFKEWFFIILCALIVIACVVFLIFYIKCVVTADIPWWMKWVLLKGR